jgi:hypothetical protein
LGKRCTSPASAGHAIKDSVVAKDFHRGVWLRCIRARTVADPEPDRSRIEITSNTTVTSGRVDEVALGLRRVAGMRRADRNARSKCRSAICRRKPMPRRSWSRTMSQLSAMARPRPMPPETASGGGRQRPFRFCTFARGPWRPAHRPLPCRLASRLMASDLARPGVCWHRREPVL